MEAKPSVLVTRNDVPKMAIDELRKWFDVDVYEKSEPIPREDLLKRIHGKAAVLCMLTDKVDADVLNSAGPQLKVVSTMSVGYDHLDVAKMKEMDIKVGYTPDVLSDATAELTVALLLATSRRLVEASAQITSGGWGSWAPLYMAGKGLRGSTVGIFGMGRIGRAVLLRLAGFGVERFLYSGRGEKELGASLPPATFVPFPSLLRQSDFVVCTAALTDETRGVFGAAAFRGMKDDAVFVNTSRGGLVDQEALYQALLTHQIGAAGLDVMTPEPLPRDHPLTSLPNCTLLPHIGSAELQTRAAMATLAAGNIIAALSGNAMPARL